MSPWGKPFVSLASCAAEIASQLPGSSGGNAGKVAPCSLQPAPALPAHLATWTVTPPPRASSAAPFEVAMLAERRAGAHLEVGSGGLVGDASWAFALESRTFGGQPCFRRPDGGQWLYYLENKKQWQVASDLGSEACVLFKPCESSPLSAFGGPKIITSAVNCTLVSVSAHSIGHHKLIAIMSRQRLCIKF